MKLALPEKIRSVIPGLWPTSPLHVTGPSPKPGVLLKNYLVVIGLRLTYKVKGEVGVVATFINRTLDCINNMNLYTGKGS